MNEQSVDVLKIKKPELSRLQRLIQLGIDKVVTPQIRFVENNTMNLYDSAIWGVLHGKARDTAVRIRPTVRRVAKTVGVSLVVAEGVIAVVGIAKGSQWLFRRLKREKAVVLPKQKSSKPVIIKDAAPTLSGKATKLKSGVGASSQAAVSHVQLHEGEKKIIKEVIAPEQAAYHVLMDEIQALKKSGKASDGLRRIMFMTANNPGTTDHGKISFRNNAVQALEYFNNEGKSVLTDAVNRYAAMQSGGVGRVSEQQLERVVENLINGARHLDGIDNISLNWWTWVYRGIGLRELVGISPDQRIYGLDYGSQWVKPPIPYIQYVKAIIDRCKPTSFDWAIRNLS